MLKVKIYFGEKPAASIGSEFIENNVKDRKCQETMSVEERKQDCKSKTFIRLAGRSKKRFSRFPILLADSLYATKLVIELCKDIIGNF